MANELFLGYGSGNNLYAVITNAANQFWHVLGYAWVVYAPGNWQYHALALTENSQSGLYYGDKPTHANFGSAAYRVSYFKKLGANPALGDTFLGMRDFLESQQSNMANLDAAVSSRATASSVWSNSIRTLTNSQTFSTSGSVGSVTGNVASVSNPVTLTSAYDAAKTAAQSGDIPTAEENAAAVAQVLNAQTILTVTSQYGIPDGTYVLYGFYNDKPYYKGSTHYIWHWTSQNKWIITTASPLAGIVPLSYWWRSDSSPIGEYTSEVEGTATVSGSYSAIGTLFDDAYATVIALGRLPVNPAAEGDKMNLVDSLNPNAIITIQSGLATQESVNAIAEKMPSKSYLVGTNNEDGDIQLDEATGVDLAAVKSQTDKIPNEPAAVGSAMTLTPAYDAAKTAAQPGDAMTLQSGDHDAIAAAVLDLANAIDGKTLRQALQIIAAVVAGKVEGAGSGTESFRSLDDGATRVVVMADAFGNRTNVTYS
ncbi:MAG TPA: hypothetical protein VIH42_11910 [Thermoguttaceae bacterium]